MKKELNPMDKLNFFIGSWKLDYIVPKSQFSCSDSGTGEGEFKSILNNKYVTFDYHSKLSKGEGAAHGIFAWDEKIKSYRYWWFDDSDEFMEATCNFLDETTLCLNWHNSLLVQTFKLIENEEITLQMKYPSNKNSHRVILEVIFTKKK